MASFDLHFGPRSVDYTSRPMYDCAEDLEVLNARVLGRADDLKGSFDSAATQFTDVIGWDIKNLSEEDQQHWRDAAVTVTYVASVVEMWADMIEAFNHECACQVSDWHNDRRAKEAAVPSAYQDATITATYPERGGFPFTGWGAGDENKCRDLYDELASTRDSLNIREETNWQKFQDNAAEVREILEQGPTPANVQRLIEAGNADWAFYNLDPERYSMLLSENLLTEENAEQWAEELTAYWTGEKPLDDRYDELMLMMTMIGTSAKQSQQDGTELNSQEIDFLEEFYARLEDEYTDERIPLDQGILTLPDRMANSEMTDEERERALGVLGNGLLALSAPDLGGGYEKLPESFRRAVEGPLLNQDDEDKTPYTTQPFAEDLEALSDLLAHTDDELKAGYGLSTNLHLSTGAFLEEADRLPEEVPPSSEQMAALIDVASRNKDSNYFMLTGLHRLQEPGVDYGDEELRRRALEGTLTYEWHDDGATARQLTDWLAEDIDSDDDVERFRAGNAFARFMETLTDPDMHDTLTNTGVDVTEGDNEYSNASFTQFNGQLADSLADIFDAHIYSFANSDVYDVDKDPVEGIGSYEHDTGLVQMGPNERVIYMQLLMGDDETAGRVVNSVDVYQQIEAAAYLESGQNASTARGAGQLQALLEQALRLESADRSADLGENIERKTQITNFIVTEAKSVAENIPVIGTTVSKGLGLGQDGIVNAIVNGEYEVSPRHPDYTSHAYIERNFRVETLDYLTRNDPQELNNVVRPDEFHTLVDGGAITIERDGEVLTSDDIGDDFTIDDSVTITVEKNPAEWINKQNAGLNQMDDAVGNIVDDIEITTSDGRTQSGDERVDDFVEDYNGAYGEVNDFFSK